MENNAHYPRPLKLQWLALLCVLLPVLGCQSTAPLSQPPHSIETILQPTPVWVEPELVPEPVPLNPTFTPKQDNVANWVLGFKEWMVTHYTTVNDYSGFLRSKDPVLPPLDQLLRSANSYERCAAEPYMLPYLELWPNMVPTVALLNALQRRGILYDFEITSGYRSPELNVCVGGARASKHMFNAALDIRLLNEQDTPYGLYVTRQKLCDFWSAEGAAYNMGLGIYQSGIIHIDTQGWRTWGPDYSAKTSICAKPQ